MTEFEKWFEKRFPDPATRGSVQYEYCVDAWNAALELARQFLIKGLKK